MKSFWGSPARPNSSKPAEQAVILQGAPGSYKVHQNNSEALTRAWQ